MHALFLGQRRPNDEEAHVGDLRDRLHDRREALRRRGAAEGQEGERLALGTLDALQAGDVDAVADRDELAGTERERPLLDAQHAGREPLGGPEQPAPAPVREPEQHVDPERRAIGAASTA